MTGRIRKQKRRIRRLLGLLIPIGAAITFVLFPKSLPQDRGIYEHSPQLQTVFQSIASPNLDVFKSDAELYMGIDRHGNLTLFDGPPDRDKPIETFFQLNIEFLETSLPHETVGQLYEGIRIHDQEEYNSVLSSMSSFIAEE